MNIQLSTHDWLEQPMEIRVKLREIFSIPRSQGTILENNTVKSDGTTYQDLSVLTAEKMQEYIGGEGDFHSLFLRVIEKIKLDLTPPPVAQIDPKQYLIDEWAAVLSRIKAEATERGMGDYLDSILKRIFDIKPTVITQNEKRKPGRPKKAK